MLVRRTWEVWLRWVGDEYVVGTRSSGIVSSVADVIDMNVVPGMRGLGWLGEVYMCLAGGGVGDEGVIG